MAVSVLRMRREGCENMSVSWKDICGSPDSTHVAILAPPLPQADQDPILNPLRQL